MREDVLRRSTGGRERPDRREVNSYKVPKDRGATEAEETGGAGTFSCKLLGEGG